MDEHARKAMHELGFDTTMMIENRIYGECLKCGAVVNDIAKHKQWHDSEQDK